MRRKSLLILSLFFWFCLPEVFAKGDKLEKEFNLPMEGGLISLGEVEEKLFLQWGPTAVPCIEEFMKFLRLWNERQVREKGDEISKIVFPKEFKKAMADFERCAEDRKIIEEKKPLESVLDGSEGRGFGNPFSSNFSSSGQISLAPKETHVHETLAVASPLSQGKISPALSRGTLGGSRISDRDSITVGSFNKPKGHLEKKKTEVQNLKENYDHILAFDQLEGERRDALIKGRGADLKAIEKEMDKKRQATKEALLSVFRNEGVSRKKRLNAYEKWATLEDEDKGGVAAGIYEEAIELIEGWNREYAEGLEKTKRRLKEVRAIDDYEGACQLMQAQAFKALGETIENMSIHKIQEVVEKAAPDSLEKDIEQDKIEILLSRKSKDPGQARHVEERQSQAQQENMSNFEERKVVTEMTEKAITLIREEKEGLEGGTKRKER